MLGEGGGCADRCERRVGRQELSAGENGRVPVTKLSIHPGDVQALVLLWTGWVGPSTRLRAERSLMMLGSLSSRFCGGYLASVGLLVGDSSS